MDLVARIEQNVKRLPPASQAAVLGFIEYLLARAARSDARTDTEFSLASAMRGMEDEDTPQFTEADLKERYG